MFEVFVKGLTIGGVLVLLGFLRRLFTFQYIKSSDKQKVFNFIINEYGFLKGVKFNLETKENYEIIEKYIDSISSSGIKKGRIKDVYVVLPKKKEDTWDVFLVLESHFWLLVKDEKVIINSYPHEQLKLQLKLD